MKKIHVLWMLLFLVLSTSCVSVNRLMKVQEGMSRQEISKIFGTPEYRRFERNGRVGISKPVSYFGRV